jgi:hypothetical protein
MPRNEHEITIRVSGTKDYIAEVKKNVKKIVDEEFSPEMASGIRDIFLYRKMTEGGSPKDWATFMTAHAGVFSAAVLENIRKKDINMASPNTNVRVEAIRGGTELVIQAAIRETSMSSFSENNMDGEAIMNLISNLDPMKATAIFNKAMREADLD